VAYHMSEWRTFRSELTAPKSDVVVLLTTFALTVIVDLTVAIEVGMVLAAFLFMRRMAEVTNVSMVTRELADADGDDEADPNAVRYRSVPQGVEVFEINGPFFFGAAEQFKDTLNQVARKPKVLIIRMRDVPAIDATGLHTLQELADVRARALGHPAGDRRGQSFWQHRRRAEPGAAASGALADSSTDYGDRYCSARNAAEKL